jgi:hypothetical protein
VWSVEVMSNVRSEFEKLLKQHRDALTDELVKLGNHRQVQLVEWDIERNETDYEFYFDGAWNAQQYKIDELQRRNQMLNENIKEQGQKLVYQNEVIETQAEKLLGLRDEKAGLQKRVDAALEITKQGIRKQGGDYYLEKLEQALKGGDE